MTRSSSKGMCSFCRTTFTKAGMTNHLKTCKQRKTATEFPSGPQQSKSRKTKSYHLLVEGRYRPMYWMHLEVQADVTLEDLDRFFRDIWLECCGHLSAFTIQRIRYQSASPYSLEEFDDESMDVALETVLQPGLKVSYEYDFGSTTELRLKVVATREGALMDDFIQVLARNEPPFIPCHSCGKPATHVCTECNWDGEGGWLCDQCAHTHKCSEEMLLPVGNSPRVGVCGYTG